MTRGFMLLLVLICVLATSKTIAQQGCDECKPIRYGYAYMAGNYKVCFQAGVFTPLEMISMATGMQHYWGDTFTYYGIAIWFEYQEGEGSGCAITVFADDAAAQDNMVAYAYFGQQSGWGSRIGINWTLLGNQRSEYEWKSTGAHELGHLLDYQQNEDWWCSDKTILYQYPQFSNNFGCGDLAALAQRFGEGDWSNLHYDYHPVPETVDCYYVYIGVDYYYWNDGWHYWDTIYSYSHTECI